MKGFFLGMLVTIAFLGVGIGGYFLGQKNTFNYLSSEPTQNVSEDISISKISPTTTPVPTTPSQTDDLSLIKKALFQKNNWDDKDDITVKISTNDGTYASGTVTSQGGGGYFYATKDLANGWVIVADGNGLIECSTLKNYPDFPNTLIPECYNSATEKSVKR